MKSEKSYDIFISYRRNGGDATARLFYERLTAMGYRVSYDIETLRGGMFNTQLYHRIEECKDVVVIMSADSLELRENIEDDWFRLEIAHALKCNKNIVPVFLRDFTMPESGSLPADIAELPNFQGVTSSDEHFDSVLKKLCKLLKSRPINKVKKIVLFTIVSVLLLSSCVSLYCFRGDLFPYPFTVEQKKEVNSWVGQMVLLGTAYNDYLVAQSDLMQGVKNSIDAGTRIVYDDAVPLFERRIKVARQKFYRASAGIKSLLEEPDCMPTDVAGVPVFLEALAIEFDETALLMGNFERIADPARPCAKHDRYRYLDLKSREIKIYAEIFAYSVMGVFYKVSPSALEEFVKIVVEWTHIPHLSETNSWVNEEKAIQQKLEKSINNLEEVVGELQTILGNETTALAQEKKDFENLMMSAGVPREEINKAMEASQYLSNLMMDENVTDDKLRTYRQKLIDAKMTPEQADSMVKKVKENIELKRKLADKEDSLAKARARVAEKFAPKESDDDGTLWSKMTILGKALLTEEALQVLNFIRKNQDKALMEKNCQVAEMVLKNPQKLPFSYGMIVCFFEPPATSHAIFQPGDVIVKVNGKDCCAYEDFMTKEGVTYIVYRLNKEGYFEKHSLVMPEKQPRVAVADLPFPDIK